jgi:hypothetical protein
MTLSINTQTNNTAIVMSVVKGSNIVVLNVIMLTAVKLNVMAQNS